MQRISSSTNEDPCLRAERFSKLSSYISTLVSTEEQYSTIINTHKLVPYFSAFSTLFVDCCFPSLYISCIFIFFQFISAVTVAK